MAKSRAETPAFLGNPQLRQDLIDVCSAAIGPAEAAIPPWLTRPFLAVDRFARQVAAAGLAVGQAVVSAGKAAGREMVSAAADLSGRSSPAPPLITRAA